MKLRYRESNNLDIDFNINLSKSDIGYNWNFSEYGFTTKTIFNIYEQALVMMINQSQKLFNEIAKQLHYYGKDRNSWKRVG